MSSLEVLKTLQNFLLINILFIEVLGDNLNCLIHRILQFNALYCTCVIWKNWSKMHSFRRRINLVVDTLTLYIQDKLLGVVLASKGQLLLELFITVWSKHHVNTLPLSWQESSTLREYLESLTFLGNCSSCRDVRFVIINPITWNFFLVFETNFNCFPGLHTDLTKVKIFRAHC